jgi:hypothetical protein
MCEGLKKTRWALARLGFIAYVIFSTVTLVGGFLTAPLMTWYFFGDWRFWRHWRHAIRLLPHGLRLAVTILLQGRGFMFSVPLTSPPRTDPDPALTVVRADWMHGGSCGTCSNCCRPGGRACPLLGKAPNGCLGFDSFYWRYFNCGRYPSIAEEIRYYGCPKWTLKRHGEAGAVAPGSRPVGAEVRLVGNVRP